MKKIATITDVAERQLCTGCGTCAYVQPDDIRMVDDVEFGRRPIVAAEAGLVGGTDEALAACPGIELAHGELPAGHLASLSTTWGPVLEVWEGYSSDADIRFTASSGGVSSALAIHAIEDRAMHGLLHIRARDDIPYLNETTLSRTREEILAAVGSRYAPASPCDGLSLIEDGPSPSVMIGKPCDIAGAAKAAAMRPELRDRLGLTIAIFCAGTPTLRGTFEMLDAMGVTEPSRVEQLRYRGNGWPGRATAAVREDDGTTQSVSMSYEESWGGILQRHRQWRCYVCADHTGEFADIAVGDPWYRAPEADEPGRSLIIIRTERGGEFFRTALDAGVIVADRMEPDRLPDAQPWLGRVRGEAGARAATLRLLGIPSPVYRNMPVWPAWIRNLTMRDKLRSTFGTMRRVGRKGLRRRHPVRPFEEPPA
jgi:coenzyme F420 hydrogenase subunit beta